MSKIYFIYGKNGFGKTTFSRTAKLFCAETISFNTDFINKNIYVSNVSGDKIDAQNNENLTEILVTGELVRLKKILEKFNNKQKNIPKIPFDKNILKEIEFEEIMQGKCRKKELEDKLCELMKKVFRTKEEYKIACKRSKELTIINLFYRDLKKIDFVCLENIEFSNDYNNSLKNIKEAEDFIIFQKKIEDWYNKGVEIHENENECLFCNSSNLHSNKYYVNNLEKLNNISLKTKILLKAKIETILSDISKVCGNSAYKEVLKLEIVQLKKIKVSLEKIRINVENNEQVVWKFDSINKSNDMELIGKVDKYEGYSSILDELCNICKDYLVKKKIINIKEKIDKKFENFINTRSVEINNICKKLGLFEEIKFKQNNTGGNKRISIDINGKEMNVLSDGEKHKLALAIFLLKIMNDDMNNKLIIFDDPIVSLDVISYFRFKSLIIELVQSKLSKTSNTKLIICSHNIHYLYEQMFNNRENFGNAIAMDSTYSFYKFIQKGKLLKQNISYVRMSDIELFKVAIAEVTNETELLLISPIINTINRKVIENMLLIIGEKPLQNDLNCYIKSLPISDDEKRIIQKNSNKIKELYPNSEKPICIKTTKKMIELLVENIELITARHIKISNKYKNITSSNEEYLIQNLICNDSNIIFDLLKSSNKYLRDNFKKNSPEKEFQNYLNHPVSQITQSIMGIDFD